MGPTLASMFNGPAPRETPIDTTATTTPHLIISPDSANNTSSDEGQDQEIDRSNIQDPDVNEQENPTRIIDSSSDEAQEQVT